MAEYLIQGETLTATADKIRDCLDMGEYSFDSNLIAQERPIYWANEQIRIHYREFVDYSDAYSQIMNEQDMNLDKSIIAYSYGFDYENNIVPILYWTSLESNPDPDTAEPLYYQGQAEVNGVTYDKWRKIDNDGFSWQDDAKQYLYTDVIVNQNDATSISPQDFPTFIQSIASSVVIGGGGGGGTDTSDATATAADILSGKTAYTSTGKITGTIAFQNAKTITPGTSNITAISKGYYASGSVIVSGSANLTAANIKSGVNIFGVTGTYQGSGGDTSIEDAIIEGTLRGIYSNPRVTYVASYAFYNRPIKVAMLPSVSYVGTCAFSACTSLTGVSLPACNTLAMSAFAGCTSLTTVIIPACQNVMSMAFYQCTNLASISLGACNRILPNAFAGCTKLSTVTIGTSNCVLSNSTAFANTQITPSKGTIKVPSAYVNAYKTASAWSYFSNRIVAG